MKRSNLPQDSFQGILAHKSLQNAPRSFLGLFTALWVLNVFFVKDYFC